MRLVLIFIFIIHNVSVVSIHDDSRFLTNAYTWHADTKRYVTLIITTAAGSVPISLDGAHRLLQETRLLPRPDPERDQRRVGCFARCDSRRHL